MRIPDQVNVELRIHARGNPVVFPYDAMLPTHMNCELLKNGLTRLISQVASDLLDNASIEEISFRGKPMSPDSTLADIGAWDGSTLELNVGGRLKLN